MYILQETGVDIDCSLNWREENLMYNIFKFMIYKKVLFLSSI